MLSAVVTFSFWLLQLGSCTHHEGKVGNGGSAPRGEAGQLHGIYFLPELNRNNLELVHLDEIQAGVPQDMGLESVGIRFCCDPILLGSGSIGIRFFLGSGSVGIRFCWDPILLGSRSVGIRIWRRNEKKQDKR